jgi:hypothetical protein
MDRSLPYHTPLERALAHALDHLGHLSEAPVTATATLRELRARLARPPNDDSADSAQVIDDLAADCADGVLGSAGGRFFGWVVSDVVALDIFAPPREDYLAHAHEGRVGTEETYPSGTPPTPQGVDER